MYNDDEAVRDYEDRAQQLVAGGPVGAWSGVEWSEGPDESGNNNYLAGVSYHNNRPLTLPPCTRPAPVSSHMDRARQTVDGLSSGTRQYS